MIIPSSKDEIKRIRQMAEMSKHALLICYFLILSLIIFSIFIVINSTLSLIEALCIGFTLIGLFCLIELVCSRVNKKMRSSFKINFKESLTSALSDVFLISTVKLKFIEDNHEYLLKISKKIQESVTDFDENKITCGGVTYYLGEDKVIVHIENSNETHSIYKNDPSYVLVKAMILDRILKKKFFEKIEKARQVNRTRTSLQKISEAIELSNTGE